MPQTSRDIVAEILRRSVQPQVAHVPDYLGQYPPYDAQQDKVQRVRAMMKVPPMPDNAPHPGIDPRLTQAEDLTQQAMPQRVAPQGIKENIVAGLMGAFHRGGYGGMMQNREAGERQRQQDLLARAQALRGESLQREQLGMQQRNAGLNEQEFGLKQQQHGFDREQFEHVKELANRPKFQNVPSDQTYGTVDPTTGRMTVQGQTPKTLAGSQSEVDKDYVDYLRHPELTKEFGSDRTGFRQYQAKQAQQGRVDVYGQTTAQNPSVIWADDPDNPGKQKPFRYNEQTRGLEPIELTKTPSAAALRETMKESGRVFLGELKKIGDRIFTNKLGYQQKMDALRRGGEAALMNDPDYRTYQDFRQSLAASLGVMEQGSRISDFDVKGIYLPMIPDVFRDTTDSAAQKWRLIEQKMGTGAAPAKDGASPVQVQQWEKGPDGLPRRKPPG